MTVKTINVEVAVAQITLRPTEAKLVTEFWNTPSSWGNYGKYVELMQRLSAELRKAGF